MEIFTGQFILFEILDYKISLIEFLGTLSGLMAVWLAAKNNIFTWPIGIVNVICFFLIFRESHLFSDMFLQVYFFGVAIYGWLFWKKTAAKNEPTISDIRLKPRLILLFVTLVFSVFVGWMMGNVHIWFSNIFPEPAAYPYADSFVAVASVIANTLMARKKVESWIMWIVIDVVATVIYYQKNILLISVEFFIFTLLAVFGLINWLKLKENEGRE